MSKSLDRLGRRLGRIASPSPASLVDSENGAELAHGIEIFFNSPNRGRPDAANPNQPLTLGVRRDNVLGQTGSKWAAERSFELSIFQPGDRTALEMERG